MSESIIQRELQVGGAVPFGTHVYIARPTDDELLRELLRGEYCNVICPRQMGKTSAIQRVRANLREQGFRTALFDISGALGTPPNASEWYLGFLSELNGQLGLGCNVKAWWTEQEPLATNQRLLAFFRKIVLGRFPDRFVVLLDEIDHTINLPYTDDFFLAIRSLYNERPVEPDLRRLAFCLVGVFTPNELVKQGGTTSFNVGRTIEFLDFDPERDDLTPLAETLSGDRILGTALLGEILQWTGGQPYLTVSACKKVSAAGITSLEAVEQLILRTFVDHINPREDSDETHFDTITKHLADRTKGLREAEDLYRRILQGEEIYDQPIAQTVALKLSGLVKSSTTGRLMVRNKIYRRRFDKSWALLGFSLGSSSVGISSTLPSGSVRLGSGEQAQRDLGLDSFIKTIGAERQPDRIISSAIFVSHAIRDDFVVRALTQALANFGQHVWLDSREMRGGDALWPVIQQAIESASAYFVLVSPHALQSEFVGEELAHALMVQQVRGRANYPVIPLSLDGTRLGVLKRLFGNEPAYIPISSAPGGLDAALDAILVALGKRLPEDRAPRPQPTAEPIEDLVLELTDLRFHETPDSICRPSARARLVYEPATPGQREVVSESPWRLIAPLGPIESEEIHWYLGKYALWPSVHFSDRARRVEAGLTEWGQSLYAVALPPEHAGSVLHAWSHIDGQAGRRFSVYVDPDATLEAGTPDTERQTAREVATALLGLPWELLHDGQGFLFRSQQPVRVRRRLPNTRVLDLPLLEPPIRILLVSPRPEDAACGYIDHRVSALALMAAIEELGRLVELTVLSPPTLPALSAELERAAATQIPYHVLHFDGHGVYERTGGLGGLCFEDPRDLGSLERRRHLTVYTETLGPILRDRRIPLVFLNACQSAQSEQASESVATELLKVGVAAVIAMSHSVLVETARRFVAAFYGALASGQRVGQAMLAGQRALHEDSSRGHIFGAGELRLQDWFVPVLYQERDDPQLFTHTPAARTDADLKTALRARLGAVPAPPETGFIGRSRDLLALERLLRPGQAKVPPENRWALIRGQGGEGKTVLACELGRWLVRSQQIERVAFCSVETQGQAAAVLDALGRQLVGKDYSAAAYATLDLACQPVERALAERPTLLIIDNLESLLLPPYLAAQTPAALTEEAQQTLTEVLALCERLLGSGETRLVFTSRETLPAPFNRTANRRELERLDPPDAVRLVERVLNLDGADTQADATREEIEALVDAVHGHARTLALLAPAIRDQGVARTRTDLVALMAEMERRFPGDRERSIYAGVELSLRRLSPANRERARVLGVFHGAVDLDVLRLMTGWEAADCAALAADLIGTGLATADPYNHLTLNPALCPLLRERLAPAEREDLTARWGKAMGQYVRFLDQQQHRQAEVAATLTVLGLPNLFALLDLVQAPGDAESTIELATSLYRLLQNIGRPRLLGRVGEVRDAAARALAHGAGAVWGHARFEAENTRIEQQLASGRLRESLNGAESLLQRAAAAGEAAYPGADYDLATAHLLLARVLKTSGAAGPALPLLDEAMQRFEAIAREPGDQAVERMPYVTLMERGDCLLDLGRLDEGSATYEEVIARAERLGDERQVAFGRLQLGTVRLMQHRYVEALDAYAEARARFTRLGEPNVVAAIWHQTGMAYQYVAQPDAAEDAYRESLAIEVRLGDVAGQAKTLAQLGSLYAVAAGRREEAVALFRQASDRYVEIGDSANEGRARTNLAETLRRLGRLAEARLEVQRAIECKGPFGHAAEPWSAWAILAAVETAAGNSEAAAAAKTEARAAYLAFRRDGGENYDTAGRIALAVAGPLLAGDQSAAAAVLQQLADRSDLPDSDPRGVRAFIQALQAIVGGSRDLALAEKPEFDYSMSAELLFLIETLSR